MSQIVAMTKSDVEQIARVHCAVLPDGFLVRLGSAVLSEIYAGALTSPGVIALVARHNRDIAGFLLATPDTRAFFRHVLLRQALPLGIRLLGAACRNPTLVVGMLESARYPSTLDGAAHTSSGGGELIAIGVRPESRSLGYATAMIDVLNSEFRRMAVTRYTVTAYSSNESAQRFYQAQRFQRLCEFRMYGAMWTRYELRLGDAEVASRRQ